MKTILFQGQDGRLQLFLCVRMARPVLPGTPSAPTLTKNTLRGPLLTLPSMCHDMFGGKPLKQFYSAWSAVQQPCHWTSILSLPTRLFWGLL